MRLASRKKNNAAVLIREVLPLDKAIGWLMKMNKVALAQSVRVTEDRTTRRI